VTSKTSEARKASSRRYYQSHRVKVLARDKQSRVLHNEEYRARERAIYRADPRKQLDRQRFYNYGLTTGAFLSLLISQQNKCAVCKTVFQNISHKTPRVDHSHKTGKVRGLLCANCNTGLGFFKDNKNFLLAAHLYLEANTI